MTKTRLTKEKGADVMLTASLLHERQTKYFEGMDTYIEQLRRQPADTAKSEAIIALKRTGVVEEDGNLKKKIVSWE